MCGIAGIVSLDPETRIGPMLESIEHRGRDDKGVWVSEPIDSDGRRTCLGHRRLAIIDTSPAGHEPMLSPDGRYVLLDADSTWLALLWGVAAAGRLAPRATVQPQPPPEPAEPADRPLVRS